MKAPIMYHVVLYEKGVDYLANPKKLNIYKLLGDTLSVEDWNELKVRNIFINVVFSPGVVSPVEKELPRDSQLINIDYNFLIKIPERERVAIILHEIGHAMNPLIKQKEGEFIADDYAIDRGFGEDLKNSLERCIIDYPLEFNKPITTERINRINAL